MEIILLFGLSVLPAIFLLWYYRRYDSARPEPSRLIMKVFKWGVLMTLIAGVIEQNLFVFVPGLIGDEFIKTSAIAFICVALVEEGLKLLVINDIIFKNRTFNEVMDGIIYTIVVSLGFATLENLFYVFNEGFYVGVARALLAVPAHALFSGIMGYYLGKAKMAKVPWEGKQFIWKGFALAVFYHGLYDFLLMTNTNLMFFIVPLLILMFFQLQYLIKMARYEDGLTKQKPMPWDRRRIVKMLLGLGFVSFGIFYGVGIKMMVEAGQYQTSDIIGNAIVYVLLGIGSFWAFRRHLLPKGKWEKERKIKKDVKKALER